MTSPDRTDSQADSAGSIPVTRSKTKMQVRAVLLGQAQLPGNRSRSFVPLAGGCAGCAAVIVALAALGLECEDSIASMIRLKRQSAVHLTREDQRQGPPHQQPAAPRSRINLPRNTT